MKKTLLLTMALGLAGATPLVAGTVDVYITGSTAFRANVYTASSKLYSPAPTIYYGSVANGGNGDLNSSDSSWVMTGTPVGTLTNFTGDTLNIHGLFTGSIQGLKSVQQAQQLIFAQPVGVANGYASTYVTNAPTIGFSDCASAVTPYPYNQASGIAEDGVAVQPFVMAASVSGVAVSDINNVSWEQLSYGLTYGRIPLSAWTGHAADDNTFIYLDERTADSGTRRTLTQGTDYNFNDTVGIYLFDVTNNDWYTPSPNVIDSSVGVSNCAAGDSPFQVIGSEGPGNGGANLLWGAGFIGGGDIKNSLNHANTANQAIACLSVSDCKGVGSSNWGTVVSYDGFWPTAAGYGIRGNTGTNDYSPITSGYYPIWGVEVIDYPTSTSGATTIPNQDLTYGQLGTSGTVNGSFLGLFNAQSLNNGGVVTVGSVENEIVISQPNGATAIPLAAMVNTRAGVGGTISPPNQ